MKKDIRAKIKHIETEIPTPKLPKGVDLDMFAKVDFDHAPDRRGKNSLSSMLTIATAISTYTIYQLGIRKSIYAVEKTKENRAIVEYWAHLDKAYERLLNNISRQISLRRDAFDRDKWGNR